MYLDVEGEMSWEVGSRDEECQDLLKQYEESGDSDIADHLIESLDAARRHRWEELMSKMNFTHSSRKSWALIHRLAMVLLNNHRSQHICQSAPMPLPLISSSILHSSAFFKQSKVYSVQTRLVSGKVEALVTRLLPSPLSSKMDSSRT